MRFHWKLLRLAGRKSQKLEFAGLRARNVSVEATGPETDQEQTLAAAHAARVRIRVFGAIPV